MKPNSPVQSRTIAKAFASHAFTRSKALRVVVIVVASGYGLWRIQAVSSPPAPAGQQGSVLVTPRVTRASQQPAPRHQELLPATAKPLPNMEKPHTPAEAELRDAFTAAAAISDPAQRTETLVRLCYQWAEIDPRAAVELAFEHGLEGAAGGVIGNLAQQWATVDMPAALAWVREQAPGEVRDDLTARIGYLWAESDPAAAAGFVIASTTPGPAQEEAAISVLHRWSRRDPAAARAWAECFPEGPLRDRALLEVGNVPTSGN